MLQGRFLQYLDEFERAERIAHLTLASYIGMAMAGGEDTQQTWNELWESTMTNEELEAHYAAGREALSTRGR